MRITKIASFADIRNFSENFSRADSALTSAVAKGHLPGIRAALGAGANPLQAQDNSGRDLFFQAFAHPNGEELLCELLAHMPALRLIETNSEQTQMVLRLEGGHAMTLTAVLEPDQAMFDRMVRFLRQTQVWAANFPRKEHEKLPLARARDANRKLLAAAAAANFQGVEVAMSEGATGLACDEQGQSVLALAAQHPLAVSTAMFAAIFANEPTLSLHEHGEHLVLRNQPLARLGKGGTALFVPPEPPGMDLPTGHHVLLQREQGTVLVRAYFRILEDLGTAIQDLAVEVAQRNLDHQLAWPSMMDFHRLFGERLDAAQQQIRHELGLADSDAA